MISLKQEDRRPAKEEPNALNKLRTASMLMGGAGVGSYLLGDYFLPKESENLLERLKRVDSVRKTPSALGYTDLGSDLLHAKLLGGNAEGLDVIKTVRNPALLRAIAPFISAPDIIEAWNKELPQNAGVLSKVQALPNLIDRFVNSDYASNVKEYAWQDGGPEGGHPSHYGAFYQGPIHALGQLYSESPMGAPAVRRFLNPGEPARSIPATLKAYASAPMLTRAQDYIESNSQKFPEAINAFIKEKTGRGDYFKGTVLNTYGLDAFPNALPMEEQKKLIYELPSWLASHEKEFPEANKAFKQMHALTQPGSYTAQIGQPLLNIKHFLQKYGLITAGAGVGAYGLYRFLKSRADKKKKEKELLEQSN